MGFKVFTLILLFYLFLIPSEIQCSNSSKPWLKIGYYNSSTVELPVSDINSKLFTHLVFSFAYIDSLSHKVFINFSDSQKFSNFTNIVKRKNPSAKTILSIFFDKDNRSSIPLSNLAQPSNRKSFIDSSIALARANGFEGLDFHGIEPKTSSDMEILDTLLKDWRFAIDSETKANDQPRLLLVMLAHPLPSLGSVSYPIDAMNKSLDWIHLKTYDYYVPIETNLTYPHAALYDPSNKIINTNMSIQEWTRIGFPSNRLVLGLPYHGQAWDVSKPEGFETNPFGLLGTRPAITMTGNVHYNILKWYIGEHMNGVKCVYDDTYVVNYCTTRQSFVNFDDVEAVRAKVSYAKKMGLLGYFAFTMAVDENWVLTRAASGEDFRDRQKKQRLLIIILTTSAIFLLSICLILCFVYKRIFKSKEIMKILKRSVQDTEWSVQTNDSDLHLFSYIDLKEATNDFSTQNFLGQGGFGPVYKGKLKNGEEIAVKRLSKTSRQGHQEFINEVLLTEKLQHVNLVRVLGYCTEKEEKLLIYEYMPNKSLDFYLFDPFEKLNLDWKRRVNIIEGVIQGLLYLQEYSNFTIIHRDVKASNILLDDKLNAKISDFGMARVFSKDKHEANTGRIVGTYGYIPPEYAKGGTYSTKYDVYSFGVLLLQIISGKRITNLFGLNKNLNLLEYAYELWKEDQGTSFVDPTLRVDTSSIYCSILRHIKVALLCVQENSSDRPSMLEISSMLKNETTPIISPKKPAFSVKEDDELLNKIEINCQKRAREENYSVCDTKISLLSPR